MSKEESKSMLTLKRHVLEPSSARPPLLQFLRQALCRPSMTFSTLLKDQPRGAP